MRQELSRNARKTFATILNMAGITLAQAETQLSSWLAADARLASGQAYSIGARSVTRSETLEKIQYWDERVKELSRAGTNGGRIRASGIIPNNG